jgi:hypothetical protein
MDVFPLCGVAMMVANTYEIKPLDFNPRFTFEQTYGMHIGMRGGASPQGFTSIDCKIAHALTCSSTLMALRKNYSNLNRLSRCVISKKSASLKRDDLLITKSGANTCNL